MVETISPNSSGSLSSTFVQELFNEIIAEAAEIHSSEVVDLCKEVLRISRNSEDLKLKNVTESSTSKRSSFFKGLLGSKEKLVPVSYSHNSNFRFGIERKIDLENAPVNGERLRASTYGRRASSILFGANFSMSMDYEDVTDIEILRAPITDICIVPRGSPCPPGYFRISKTPTLHKANLNAGSGGAKMYLAIKKDNDMSSLPVTGLVVIFPDRFEFIPPGYTVVRSEGSPCNLNSGSGGEKVYLCMKKDGYGNPIVDLQPLIMSKGDVCPANFQLLSYSPSGVPANINSSTSGHPMFISYFQPLLSLSCLRNTSLVDVFNDSLGSGGTSLPGMLSSLPSPSSSDVFTDSSAPSLASGTPSSSKSRSRSSTGNMNHSPGQHDHIDGDDGIMHYDDSISQKFNPNHIGRSLMVVTEGEGEVVSEMRRVLLLALLTCIHTRREKTPGGVGKLAVLALQKLLVDTDFHQADIAGSGCGGNVATVTVFDLILEALVDRLEVCSESDHDVILQYFRTLFKVKLLRLSDLANQYLFRGITYLSTYYSARANWTMLPVVTPVNVDGTDIFAATVFDEYLWSISALSEHSSKTPTAHLPDSYRFSPIECGSVSECEVNAMVWELVNDVIDSVETARLADLAFVMCSKHSFSFHLQNSFWDGINSVAVHLFSGRDIRADFSIMCGLVQLACRPMRSNETGGPSPRELGLKLFALEYLGAFLSSAGTHLSSSKTFGFQIRRLVVPCVLQNIAQGMRDYRVFVKVLQVITTLWKVWRQHLLIEFALLCERVIFQILQASTMKIRPDFQLVTLKEVVRWLDEPNNIVEMFANYDMDHRFLANWNVFAHLVRAVTTIVRRLGADLKSTGIKNFDTSIVTINEVNMVALQEASHIAKTLMDTTGHAHLMIKDERFRKRSLLQGGWATDEAGVEPGKITPDKRASVSGIRATRAVQKEAEVVLAEADKIFKEKKSLHKVIKYIVSVGFIHDNPQEIVNFLRVYKSRYDETAMGDYLGEGGVSQAEQEFWNDIRYRYTRAVSFVEVEIEPALRLFLTGCGFRLPGESQKIERFMEVFATTFWQDNHGTPFCPFQNRDVILVVSYAVIMLNTDLHRANTDNRKKTKRMTKEDFLRNLRGCDNGSDIDPAYLGRIYDTIYAKPIELEVSSAELGGAEANSQAKAHDRATLSVKSTAISQDLSKNIRDTEDLLRSLSAYYYHFQLTGLDVNISVDLVSFMFESVWFHFHAITEVLLSRLFEDTQISFLALDILNYCLVSCIFLDLKCERMEFANQYLKFLEVCNQSFVSVTSTAIVPSKSSENIAVLGDPSGVVKAPEKVVPVVKPMWYELIENVTPENAMDVVALVYKMVASQKEAIQNNTSLELVKKIASHIERKARVLENNTSFLRENDMVKLSRTGKETKYHFFLFSDYLYYCHVGFGGEYKVHEALNLLELSVSDRESDTSGCSFHISHPSKSFVVVAENMDMKLDWINDIRRSIQNCEIKRDKSLKESTLSNIQQRRISYTDVPNPKRKSAVEFVSTGAKEVSSPESSASNAM